MFFGALCVKRRVVAPTAVMPWTSVTCKDIMGIAHHPRVASWPLRALLEARVLSGLVAGQQKERILQCQRLLRQWEHDFVLSVHHSGSLFCPLQVQSLQWFLCEEF